MPMQPGCWIRNKAIEVLQQFRQILVVNGAKAALPDDDELVLERLPGGDALGAEGLVFDFQQVLYPGVFEHGCRRPKVKMFVGVLDLHVNDGSVLFEHNLACQR